MTFGDAAVLFGDTLVLLGLVGIFVVYRLERSASNRRDIDSVLAMLEAVRDGIRPWGDLYFVDGYDVQKARARAQQDFDRVMERTYGQVFRVPTEPLTTLVERPGEGRLVRRETIEAANVALWQIGVFNQLVQQQTDFNARHVADFKDAALPEHRRRALAEAARALSTLLHLRGIGNAAWYGKLMDEIQANVELLNERRQRRWWSRSTS